ncbi:MAG TPA: hypothetical protein VIP46_03845 [Pyrinomonadaceae bacterium]
MIELMRSLISASALVAVTSCASVFAGQPTAGATPPGQCGEKRENGKLDKPHVVEGESYPVPKLRLRVVDDKTGRPVAGRRVSVSFGWEWFEYSSPGGPLGAWWSGSEAVTCVTDKEGYVNLPQWTVVPKGWYGGEALVGRKPEIDGFGVAVFFETHTASNHFKRDAFDALVEAKIDPFPIRVSTVRDPDF